MQKVVSTLKTIISPEQHINNIDNIINDSDIYEIDIAEYETNLNLQNQENIQLNIFINELIIFIIKKHDEGIMLDQIKQVIIQQINQSTGELMKLLSQNQTESQYIWFLGLFYHYGIGIDKDNNKAFRLFLKAAKDNYSIAQVYLADYYYKHEENYNLAFKYY